MPKKLSLTPEAQHDLDEAFDWYEERNEGLGNEFIRCIDAKLISIQRNPQQNKVVFKEFVRRALINRFPFSIYYMNGPNTVTVFAILHQRREPRSWKSRTPITNT